MFPYKITLSSIYKFHGSIWDFQFIFTTPSEVKFVAIAKYLNQGARAILLSTNAESKYLDTLKNHPRHLIATPNSNFGFCVFPSTISLIDISTMKEISSTYFSGIVSYYWWENDKVVNIVTDGSIIKFRIAAENNIGNGYFICW